MDAPETALFVTCLVDQFFPQVGEATVNLLEGAGCRVAFPEAQTCCGQPAYNMGYRAEARELARRFVSIFEPYDAIVAPSGSCTSMVRVFYPELLSAEPEWHGRAKTLARRVFELTEFLAARGFFPKSRFKGKVTCHDSCHLLRELKVKSQPRSLLRSVEGVELVEMEESDACCGFGGAFSVKFPEISSSMLESKLASAEATGADVLTTADCGCLMQLAGALRRRGSRLQIRHVAEILADGA